MIKNRISLKKYSENKKFRSNINLLFNFRLKINEFYNIFMQIKFLKKLIKL